MNGRIVAGIGIALVAIATVHYFYTKNTKETQSVPPINTSLTSSKSPASGVYYPMTHYEARITNRGYGKTIVPSDNQSLPCGAAFSGLHVGDDLEVDGSELTVQIPVYSIADGIVREVTTINGYGGLLVTQHTLAQQTVTAYYGHINVASIKHKAGDTVKAGEQLATLGNACSAQTGGERKHLHFALHKGATMNVKGYVSSEAQLQDWINPKELFKTLTAQEP